MPRLFVRKQKQFLSYYLIWTPYILTYVLTNRFPVREPVQLPVTWLDEAIPFLPFMIPVYVSYLVYAFIVIARSREDHEVNEIFHITHVQLLTCLVFFLSFPVTFPRDLYYFSDPLTSLFNRFWIWFDAPNNCFPSLHTANCCLAIHYSLDKKHRWLFVTWGLLIIAGTLTCKQHYVIDILAGMLVYVFSLKVSEWLGVGYKKTPLQTGGGP